MSGFVAGAEGTLKVPVPAFLIDHPRGLALFDAGMHPDAATDPRGRLGFLSKLFEVDMEPGQNVAALLQDLEIDPARVRTLILSHLHFDHAGGCELLPNARLIVQRPEWEAGADPDVAMRNGFDRKDYSLGHDVLAVRGEHDVFGDGRVVCFPTYGHTPGHQSLRVRLDDGAEVILCADACYLRENLERMVLPSVVHDRRRMMESLSVLRGLRDRGGLLIYGHDPAGWDGLADHRQPLTRALLTCA
ncbi:MAG TPA: N-acyl homoserine lactonase family protein [Candidatus Limnocylindrales bacterium]|nr:N-acyl homoserine lactonase family protein [Candidatus Limnocylindrales bacterium]